MLTFLQREVLDFVTRYQRDNRGVSPSYQEIADGVGSGSKSHIGAMLDEIEARGFIRRLPNRARAIEIVNRSQLDGVPTHELVAELKRRDALT